MMKSLYFSFRVVSHSVPRTGHSEVKELDNNEIYSDKQHWPNLLNGKELYTEDICSAATAGGLCEQLTSFTPLVPR